MFYQSIPINNLNIKSHNMFEIWSWFNEILFKVVFVFQKFKILYGYIRDVPSYDKFARAILFRAVLEWQRSGCRTSRRVKTVFRKRSCSTLHIILSQAPYDTCYEKNNTVNVKWTLFINNYYLFCQPENWSSINRSRHCSVTRILLEFS